MGSLLHVYLLPSSPRSPSPTANLYPYAVATRKRGQRHIQTTPRRFAKDSWCCAALSGLVASFLVFALEPGSNINIVIAIYLGASMPNAVARGAETLSALLRAS